MLRYCLSLLFFLFALPACQSSNGDQDTIYRACVENCEKTGCIDNKCFVNCKPAINGDDQQQTAKTKCPYDAWIQWDCINECRYQCMILREKSRNEDGLSPVKYHGKWPIIRVIGLQGKMGPYYEYCDVWILYGMASLNSWFWSALFHGRDTSFTERWDYSSAIALLGLALIVAIIRSLNLKIEATRVMVAAPVIAFVATHILYMNFYEFDYGWNIKVCVTMGILQGLIWAVWAGHTRHPSKTKLWFVVLAGLLAMLLEVFDFPPILGSFDAHSLWHAATIPLSLLWWSFVKDDALCRTTQLLRRADITVDSKKVD